jgi:hypothetical protein
MAKRIERSVLFRIADKLRVPTLPGPTKEDIRRMTQLVDKGSIIKLRKTYFDINSPQREIAARELEGIVMKGQIQDKFRKQLIEFVWDRGSELKNPDKARERVGLADLASSN